MATLTVGSGFPYLTIAAAMKDASPGDTILLATGYINDEAIVSKEDITIKGDINSTGIVLTLGEGVIGVTLAGAAPIDVMDSDLSGGLITGNIGDNVITVSGGIDIVDGGLGVDRVVVDYSASAGVVTATTAVIGGDLGTVSVSGVENFTVLTGVGADTLTFTTANGDNYIDAGDGANTIVVGSGTNTVIAGSGIDTITVGNGNNYIDAGLETAGANTLLVGSGDNTIIGSNGIDTITTGGGNNYIYAGEGANTITVGPTFFGNNTIIGGSGIDTMTIGGGDNCIDAGFGTAGANTITVGPTFSGNNKILGSDGIDTITVGNGTNYIAAGDGANVITAGFGNNFITASDAIDTITAMGGNNVIEAGGGANTVTTGLGNDVVKTGNAADTVATGADNDIIKDAGGAGTLTAGPGHDRLIMDLSVSTAPVSNTAVNVLGTYSGIIDATTYAGVEEFHITTGSGNDAIVTGDGADVLDGGAGADTLSAGGGSDVIYGGVGDVIDGGENADGSDFDLLVLKNFGPYEIVLTNPNNSENGTVFQLDQPGGSRTGGEVKFTNIERIEFGDNAVTIPEDTVWNDDLDLSTTTTVSTFVVGSTSYNAGDIATRTEGDLQINANGTYTFTPAANYNGPGPVTTYTTVDITDPANPVTVTAHLVIEVAPVDEEIPACLTGPIPPVPCFVEGAQIKTANGEVAVEDLKIGDLVQTLDHGLQPLRWVGRRHLNARELAENDNLRPIRISKTVVGAENGVHDLVVSPQHRILIASKVAERMFNSTEVLVAAKHLLAIEGVDIAYDLEEVTYFHILFDNHEIVYAGGIPSESLYLGHQVQLSLSSDGWEEIVALFPEVASPNFMPISCRLLIGGRQAKKLGLRHGKNSMPLLNAHIAHYQPKIMGGEAA